MKQSTIFQLYIFTILLTCTYLVNAQEQLLQTEQGYSDIAIAPDGEKLIFNEDGNPGLYLAEANGGKSVKIASGIGSAYRAQWSADSRYVAFKLIENVNGVFVQSPCLYDVLKRNIRRLHEPVHQSGIPSMSATNQIAFTINNQLFLTDTLGNIQKQFRLPAYANQTPIAPDGSHIIYNDWNDRLWLLSTVDGSTRQLNTDSPGCFEPVWAPDSRHFAASTLDGNLVIVDIADGSARFIGPGRHAAWNEDGLIFSRAEVIEATAILNIDLYRADYEGRLTRLTDTEAKWEDYPVFHPLKKQLLFSDRKQGLIQKASLSTDNNNFTLEDAATLHFPDAPQESISPPQSAIPENQPQAVNATYFDIPYVHQVYDTPDWFNGYSACGGTSAVMCLAYYNLIEPWPVEVSYPYSHTSYFGNYICRKYEFNDYTFDIYAYDPSGNKGYGAFGHIVRNGSWAWYDTKGFMADYARKHGLESGVDWSPSRGKLIGEMDLEKPFVLLNSLTTSGHYISVIGYANNQATTIIVNDPYGNKNNGYTNFYGQRVKYDWPGYSNGHSNLNTVHCFIYFRGVRANRPDLIAENQLFGADTLEVNHTFQFSGQIKNIGDTLSGPSTAALILSNDDQLVPGEDIVLKTIPTDPVDAGDSLKLNLDFTLPDSLISGNFFIGLYADYNNETIEMVVDNNFDCTEIPVFGYPRIFRTTPLGTTSDAEVPVKAYFMDSFLTVDTTSVELFVDNIDATALSDKGLNNIIYEPGTPFSAGTHEVQVFVANDKGYTAEKTWQFTVEGETGLAGRQVVMPSETMLLQNYPNPFNNTTNIRYALSKPGYAKIDIYNLSGDKVRSLFNGFKTSGTYRINWDGLSDQGQTLASGVYFVRLESVAGSSVKRMILLK